MKPANLVFVIGSLWFGVALACDDHIGKCEIEEWRWDYTAIMETLTIEGSATCDTGKVSMRLYDGEGEGAEFLGVRDRIYHRARLQGHEDWYQQTRIAFLQIQHSIRRGEGGDRILDHLCNPSCVGAL